jgi:hypothetical protein
MIVIVPSLRRCLDGIGQIVLLLTARVRPAGRSLAVYVASGQSMPSPASWACWPGMVRREGGKFWFEMLTEIKK